MRAFAAAYHVETTVVHKQCSEEVHRKTTGAVCQSQPRRIAEATAAVRELTPSLLKMPVTYDVTVR
jgi:hypothetical protein